MNNKTTKTCKKKQKNSRIKYNNKLKTPILRRRDKNYDASNA